MHPFHDYIVKQLSGKLAKRRVVVWYDLRQEFHGFVRELRGGREIDACTLESVAIGGLKGHLCCYAGSQFQVKHAVEPIMSQNDPEPLLVYLPGIAREDETTNALLELDRSGVGFDWKLAQLAHLCLRDFFSMDQVDKMLAGEVTYGDVAQILKNAQSAGGGSDGSILSAIFPDARDNAHRLAAWLASPESDEAITNKGGRGEIERLLGKAGMAADEKAALSDLRLKAARHILIGDFVLDLKGDRPASVALVHPPKNVDQERVLRQTANAMRLKHADAYMALADQVEREFQLATAAISPTDLGSVDTFRFEEQALLQHAGSLIAGRQYAEVTEVVHTHARSFWADREQRRQQQWEACRRMAALGVAMAVVRQSLPKEGSPVAQWLGGYPDAQTGWYRADMLYRQLESHLASMGDVPDSEAAHATVTSEYDDLLNTMADAFMAAFKVAGWQFPKGTFRLTHVFDEIVAKPGKSGGLTAIFLADSLRYEMGVELSRQFEDAKDLVLKAAVAAIPTITPIGMSALLPGAGTSFDVVESNGNLGGRIGGKVMTDLKERLTFLKASVPGAKVLELDDVLSDNNSKLKKRIEGATLVAVRVQDIDQLGETGKATLARQVMDMSVSNIARAIRKLAQNGVSRFVIAADHGHLFGKEKDESMRIDSPGGQTVELHRRCWIGRGGVTPPGTVRISGQQLGYDSDLDFVFPTGSGVFKAGGDLGYHHGGLSLQELIVPVLVIELPTQAKAASERLAIEVTDVPSRVTNRMFRISVRVSGDLWQGKIVLRPSLVCKGMQVGEAAMALDGDFDPTTKFVTVEPGKTVAIMMSLKRDDVKDLRLLIEDAGSGAALYQPSTDIPVDVI